MRKRKLHISTLVVGCIVVFLINLSQFTQLEAGFNEKVKTEQNNKTSSEETVVSLPSFSIPTPVNLQANLDAYCLFEIVFEHQVNELPADNISNFTDQLLVTLFRVIISPNAP